MECTDGVHAGEAAARHLLVEHGLVAEVAAGAAPLLGDVGAQQARSGRPCATAHGRHARAFARPRRRAACAPRRSAPRCRGTARGPGRSRSGGTGWAWAPPRAKKAARRKTTGPRKGLSSKTGIGVADGTRTHDDQNHNLGLYQLSYSHRRTTAIIAAPRRGSSSAGRRFRALGGRRRHQDLRLEAVLEQLVVGQRLGAGPHAGVLGLPLPPRRPAARRRAARCG